MKNVNKIKILHIVGAMNRAGTETMLMNIYRNIDREKIHFDFVSYSNEEANYDNEIKRLGGTIIKLTKTGSIKEIYDVIKKYGPYDAVHSHTLFHSGIACLAAKLAGVKVRISHAHTTNDKNDTLIRKLYIKCMRFLINNCSTNLLACSKEAGNYLFGENALSKNIYSYFPNLIDYHEFLKVNQTEVQIFKEEEGLTDSIIIGHIGRFTEVKNHLFLLEIMKSIVTKNPKFKMILVGDGELRYQIEETARKKGLNNHIKFVGVRNDISTMLQSMDIFVFPSKFEGLGLVLLEAQASGLPCIVSDAVQPESNIQIGLLTQLSLNDNAEVWADIIIDRAGKKEKNIKKINNGFIQEGYSINSGISKLFNLYVN